MVKCGGVTDWLAMEKMVNWSFGLEVCHGRDLVLEGLVIVILRRWLLKQQIRL
ncbi:MAG: hypothetical protein UW94_C0001G0084 [Parcubacteria group bacterium GW2011_GWA2_45_14]|nr:MAG: hypothetical protein UW94_C0001G0084 [Parcubacteria group bacterium GW2011_GWA2_45_14]